MGIDEVHTYVYNVMFDCTLTLSWKTAQPHRLEIINSSDLVLRTDRMKEEKLYKGFSFDSNILNVAYSVLGGNDFINTYEHFLYAIKNGFNALKADISLTSDDELVCWHGNIGFASNGKI